MRLVTGLVLTAVLGACSRGSRSELSGAQPTYDGRWWHTASELQRRGFVLGAIECVGGEYGLTLPQWAGSTVDGVRDSITSSFRLASASAKEPVLRLLLGSAYDADPQPPKRDSAFTGSNGLDWLRMRERGPSDEQLGYVEGFIECYRHFMPKDGARFVLRASDYQREVSEWYRLDTATGDMDAERQPKRVADVLRLLVADSSASH